MRSYIAISIVLAVSLFSFSYIQKEINSFNPQPAEMLVTTPNYLHELYTLAPIMKKVAECESGDRQFDKYGNVVMGEISADIGRFQINYVHWKKADQMGIDLHTEQGNAEYALYLYNQKGTQPWKNSSHCWKPYLASQS